MCGLRFGYNSSVRRHGREEYENPRNQHQEAVVDQCLGIIAGKVRSVPPKHEA